jgi:hypothetical protein
MRVWPLPVVQPWQETPDLVLGWLAERRGAGILVTSNCVC